MPSAREDTRVGEIDGGLFHGDDIIYNIASNNICQKDAWLAGLTYGSSTQNSDLHGFPTIESYRCCILKSKRLYKDCKAIPALPLITGSPEVVKCEEGYFVTGTFA
jgi:hypothetical protein